MGESTVRGNQLMSVAQFGLFLLALSAAAICCAVRAATVESAGFIVEQLKEVDWAGQVITAEGEQIFLNAGSNSGVQVGDTFTVTNIAKELVDPASGVVLGRIERRMGTVEVQSVTDLYAIARVQGQFPVRRGDYLRY